MQLAAWILKSTMFTFTQLRHTILLEHIHDDALSALLDLLDLLYCCSLLRWA